MEAAADWASLRSPENYLGYERTDNFVAPNGSILDTSYAYAAPTRLGLNHWALSGDWTVHRQAIVLNQAEWADPLPLPRPRPAPGHGPDHTRRSHPVPGTSTGSPRAPPTAPTSTTGARHPTDPRLYQLIRQPGPSATGAAHGSDVDDQGNGTLSDPRLYQLVRQPGPVSERTFEITFLDPGVQAYAFTFG